MILLVAKTSFPGLSQPRSQGHSCDSRSERSLDAPSKHAIFGPVDRQLETVTILAGSSSGVYSVSFPTLVFIGFIVFPFLLF